MMETLEVAWERGFIGPARAGGRLQGEEESVSL